MPGPSSEIEITILSAFHQAFHFDLLPREIDRILQNVADAVEDRRIAHAGRLWGVGDGTYIDGICRRSRCGATASSISCERHAVEWRACSNSTA